MRLLFLTNFYPPFHLGGYEELCAEVGDGLKQRGHHVFVLTSDHKRAEIIKAENNIYRELHLEVDLRPFRALANFFLNRQKYQDENLVILNRVVTETQPDCLVVWGMWNLPRNLVFTAEARKFPPVVFYIADYWPQLPDAYTLYWQVPARHSLVLPIKRGLSMIALRLLANQTTRPLQFKNTLTVSQAVRNHLVNAGIPIGNARVVHNGIDIATFRVANNTPKQLTPGGRLSLLYAGRLTPEKGVHTAVEALSILFNNQQPVHLTVLGNGHQEYVQRLKESCADLERTGIITFMNKVAREQMPHLLYQFDVLLSPSIWAEPLPRIVQEAMAAGLVVLGTEVGGMPEILEDGVNGLIFQAGDAEGLANCVERLITDPELLSKFSAAGQQTVERKFDIRRMLDEIEDYLEEVSRKPLIS